jgi:hypothetical protein
VARLLGEFFDSFNRGDPAAADHVVFGVAPGGGWYSVTEGNPKEGGRHFVTSERRELVRYFAVRHRQHERLWLREVTVGYDNGLGQIEYTLTRRAADLRRLGVATSRAEGKGAIDCERRKIVVWSMGMPIGHERNRHRARLCPRPAAAKRVSVACVRP